MLLAAVYSSTIAVVLTVAGVLLLRLVQPVSQHWATNLVLGGLFVFFALSLFGMYDIMLPSWLGRLTAGGEGRGGLAGVVFMALTFTVISFACVAPFYGGFIALTASAASAADWIKLVLRRPRLLRHLRPAVLRAGAVPVAAQSAAEKRLVDEHGQGGDGLPGAGRRLQVPPRRRDQLFLQIGVLDI